MKKNSLLLLALAGIALAYYFITRGKSKAVPASQSGTANRIDKSTGKARMQPTQSNLVAQRTKSANSTVSSALSAASATASLLSSLFGGKSKQGSGGMSVGTGAPPQRASKAPPDKGLGKKTPMGVMTGGSTGGYGPTYDVAGFNQWEQDWQDYVDSLPAYDPAGFDAWEQDWQDYVDSLPAAGGAPADTWQGQDMSYGDYNYSSDVGNYGADTSYGDYWSSGADMWDMGGDLQYSE